MAAPDFLRAKNEHRRLSMVTCYDYTFARLVARTDVDGILVGDSAGMVMHGYPTTLSVTLDLMRIHTEAVSRGAPEKFIVADMPFLSFRKGLESAMEAAPVLMRAGAHALKLEGVFGHEDVIGRMVQSGIPVMGHIGMQPQSVRSYGGFHVQGKANGAATGIMREAKALEELGVFSIVLECIPSELAAGITNSVHVPTIGIGAGAGCDGQILVLHDLLGLNPDFRPKFARHFLAGTDGVLGAIAGFDQAVKSGEFPAPQESYS